jgi:hypothetical protein
MLPRQLFQGLSRIQRPRNTDSRKIENIVDPMSELTLEHKSISVMNIWKRLEDQFDEVVIPIQISTSKAMNNQRNTPRRESQLMQECRCSGEMYRKRTPALQ